MAPVIPLLDRKEVDSRVKSRHLTDCRLKSLTQFQCEFETGSGSSSGNPRIVCHPFKRLFQQCVSHGATATATAGESRRNKSKKGNVAVTRTTNSLVNVEVTQPARA